MLLHKPLNASELCRAEPKITRERHRRQSEFRGLIVAVHLDVRRLVQVVANEVDSVWATPQDGRHFAALAPCPHPAEK